MGIKWRDLADRYGLVSKLFHWFVGILIIVLLVMGIVMEDMPRGNEKFELLKLHKQLGVLVLLLVFFRITWRLKQRGFIAPLPNTPFWQIKLAAIVQWLFYLLMIVVPVSGYLQSSAKGYPTYFFGTKLPLLIEKNELIAELSHEIHELSTTLIMVLLVLHIGGAVFHWFKGKPIIKRII